MDLSNLTPPEGANQNAERVGRGEGSGSGKTCGRGHKGQKARSGGNVHPRFEGGQMPIYRRLPKYGFNNPNKDRVASINVGYLEHKFDDGEVVDIERLRDEGSVSGQFDAVKILGDGELTTELTVRVNRFSDSAREQIENAGGTAEVI
ncbi:MAG: 50S ribosomal protein L15 [Bradymonadaceae bacterium]